MTEQVSSSGNPRAFNRDNKIRVGNPHILGEAIG